MANLDRFKKLERARPDDSQPKRTESHARFEGVGQDPASPSGERRSGAPVERFATAPQASGDQPLRLKEDDGGLSFVRCCHCRADNTASATRCRICDADLATEDQRRFNEELFRALEEQREAERRASEAMEAARRQAEAERREASRRLAGQQQPSLAEEAGWHVHRGFGGFGRTRAHFRPGGLVAGLVLRYAREDPGRLKPLLAVMGALDVLLLAVVLLTGHGLSFLVLLLVLEVSVALRVWFRLRSE